MRRRAEIIHDEDLYVLVLWDRQGRELMRSRRATMTQCEIWRANYLRSGAFYLS